MNKTGHISLWFLLAMSITATSCRSQQYSSLNQTYEPYSEHQYYIKPENDTLLIHLFKKTMSSEEINLSQEGRILMEVKIDYTGTITDVAFKKVIKFYLSDDVKEVLYVKIKEKIKFILSDDARNWYAGKPIIVYLTILGKSLNN